MDGSLNFKTIGEEVMNVSVMNLKLRKKRERIGEQVEKRRKKGYLYLYQLWNRQYNLTTAKRLRSPLFLLSEAFLAFEFLDLSYSCVHFISH